MDPFTTTRFRNALAQIAVDSFAVRAFTPHVIEHDLPFSSMTEGDWREAVRLWRLHAAELLATVPARPCPACESAQSRWLFESYDLHAYHECCECGCWFVPQRVDWAVFDRLFSTNLEAAALAAKMMGRRDTDAGRDADMARVGGYLDDLLPLLTPPPIGPIAYLDLGCGVGHSLRAGLARGLRVQGVEVDSNAIELARSNGLPVATPDGTLPPGPYQLLSFWETLEHISEPLAALQRYLPLLAPDGLVAITVPNLNALATRIMREDCPWIHGGYNTPGHLNMFHAAAIERLLSRAGLTLLDADGQFSGNPVELLASLGGLTRGAFDNLNPSLTRGTLPEPIESFVKKSWPGAALIERVALASPILAVVACRNGEEARFAEAIAARRRRRQHEIAAIAASLINDETDYKAMSADLQDEIDHRDAAYQSKLTATQAEIALRDALLETERARFNRTIEGRLLSVVRLLERTLRRIGGSF